eukprot:SAG31_NODE_3663_length_4010_cov_4.327330_6_plen_108_part_00
MRLRYRVVDSAWFEEAEENNIIRPALDTGKQYNYSTNYIAPAWFEEAEASCCANSRFSAACAASRTSNAFTYKVDEGLIGIDWDYQLGLIGVNWDYQLGLSIGIDWD